VVEMSCPWCEAPLGVEFDAEQQEQSCPECLTSWSYEIVDQPEVALAA
jgi:hypothetical protein